MLAQAAEMGRVLNDGLIKHHQDAEVGAILGLGFAPASGGPLSWMDERGLRWVVTELRSLARVHGERFEPAPYLVEMAERNASFWGEWKPGLTASGLNHCCSHRTKAGIAAQLSQAYGATDARPPDHSTRWVSC